MDFKNRIMEFSAKIPEVKGHLQTEEATKNALVLPFLQILGYNPFDPTEICPEFTSDVGTKKGEKVDYAVMLNGQPVILIECKCNGANLDESHCSQLYRYFTNTSARIGILTNGIEYRFFSDLEKSNLMDQKPFMVFDIERPEEGLISELKKLTKENFDLDATISAASQLKYTREIKKLLAAEIRHPSEEFIRFFASQVYPGRLTQQVREWFGGIVKRSVSQYVSDVINERLSSAMTGPEPATEEENDREEGQAQENDTCGKRKIVTTEEEMEGYYIVKSIMREIVSPDRVAMRDKVSYCGILLDDNNRKPICRLYLNTSQWYIGVFDSDRKEQKMPIENLNDIFQYAEQLKELPESYGV